MTDTEDNDLTAGGAGGHARRGDPDYAVSLVPAAARMEKFSMQMAYWAPVSALFPVVFAGVLAAQYGAMNAMAGTLAAMIVIGVLAGVMARFAIRTGMSTDLFSRAVFGKSGGLLATLLLFGTTTFFAVVESAIIAEAFIGYFPSIAPWQAYLIVVLLCAPLAFGGLALYIDKFNGLLLPFFVIGMAVIITAAIAQNGYDNTWMTFGPEGGRIDGRAFNVFFLWTLLGVQLMATLDYARFGKPADRDYHARVTFGFPMYFCTFSINGAIGIFLTATVASTVGDFASETAAVNAILQLTGFIGLLFVIISQMRINTLNYQLATVNFQAFLKHMSIDISKVLSAIVIGISVFVFMLGNVLGVLLGALVYTGIFLGAWAAMAVVHVMASGYDAIMQQHAEAEKHPDANFWHPSTFVWLAASALGIATNLWVAPLAGYSSAIAAAAAGVLYLAYMKRDLVMRPVKT